MSLANNMKSLVVQRGVLKERISAEVLGAAAMVGDAARFLDVRPERGNACAEATDSAACDDATKGSSQPVDADDSTDCGSSTAGGDLDAWDAQSLNSRSIDGIQAAKMQLDNLVDVAAESSVIFFDYDDTLLPTSHLKIAQALRSSQDGVGLALASKLYQRLLLHAQEVAETLRSARQLGRVAIVTLSTRGWVHSSAAQYLPGLDIQKLLDELDIPIYYAAEHATGHIARHVKQRSRFLHTLMQEGADVWGYCKRCAMQKYLRTVCNKRGQVRLNVLSVGDSNVEKNALKDLLWRPQHARLPEGDHPCKTIKFIEDPTIDQLSEQLQMLRLQFRAIMATPEDLDYDVVEMEEGQPKFTVYQP